MKKTNAMMKSAQRGKWYVNDAGTDYKIDVTLTPKKDYTPPSKALAPFLRGEASGDFELAVLLAVRNLLRSPVTYCNNARAQSKSGRPVEPSCSDAVCWNIFGAVEYITAPDVPAAMRRDIIQLIKRCLPKAEAHIPLFKWEEDNGHNRVLHLLNTAIGRRKQDPDYLALVGATGEQ